MEQLTNFARTTLNGAINDTDLSITLTDASAFPTKSFHIIVEPNGGNKEIIFVASRSANVLTVADRGSQGTTAISHANGVQVIHTSLAHNFPTHTDRSTTNNPDISAVRDGSDEFDDETLDPAWTRVDKVGNSAGTTWSEGNDVLSVRHNTVDASAEWHGLVKSIGSLTAPITLETCTRSVLVGNTNYLMYGLVFTNNPNWGSGSQFGTMPFEGATSGAVICSTRSFNNWNTQSSTTGQFGADITNHLMRPMYQRVRWNGDNTWDSWFSPDGVSWKPQAVGVSYTMTPSHFGFWISHWGGTKDSIAAFDYFRIY